MGGGQGSGYVFFDGQKESGRIFMLSGEEKIEVAGVFESAVVGLAGDCDKILKIFLLERSGLIDSFQFLPSRFVDMFLLMRKKFEVLAKTYSTSDTSSSSIYRLSSASTKGVFGILRGVFLNVSLWMSRWMSASMVSGSCCIRNWGYNSYTFYIA
jgi:hypothetical protein